MRFIAYDLLECEGVDIRAEPLEQRQRQLSAVLAELHHPEQWRLMQSPSWDLSQWSAGFARNSAREKRAEGLMVKHRSSPYLVAANGALVETQTRPDEPRCRSALCPGGQRTASQPVHRLHLRSWSEGDEPQLVSFAKAYSGLNDAEILELDRWIRRNTLQRFGPARSVKAEQVFEIGFEGIHPSKRHKSGIAVRFPRILRWRRDKPVLEADRLNQALALIEPAEEN